MHSSFNAEIVVFFSILLLCAGFEDNSIIGHPEIHCNSDTIDMQFKTTKRFTGKVFVKGNYNHPECRVDYGIRSADGRPVGGIRLNHGACNMDRQRTISPEGMMFSTVLIISFHPLFLTKMDKAYHIKCMYRETDRTVQVNLDVSSLPTESMQSDIAMPSCSYTIRRDSLDGEVLQYARVGDQVVHRWQCDSDEYGVLVHSCFVEDGQGEKQLIVDENGCHTDRLLLGDPTYVEALNMAYRESFVFKFADRVAVRFQCEIRLCLKDDGGCDGITPPLCIDSNLINLRNSDALGNNTSTPGRPKRSSSFVPRDADLISQTVYVMDKEFEDEKEKSSPFSASPSSVCISYKSIVSLVTIVSLFLVLSTTTLLYVMYIRCNRSTFVVHKQNMRLF